MGFTKLDERILQSSVMGEDSDTFKVWIALLASCREAGLASVSSVFLSSVCRLPIEVIDRSLNILEAPDPRSRSLDDDGRRIKRVDGGYLIINYSKYRGHTYSKKPEAVRKRIYRERKDVGHERPIESQVEGHCGTLMGHSASASVLINNTTTKKEYTTRIDSIISKWNNFADQYRLAKIIEIEKGSAREVQLKERMKKDGFNFDSLLETISKSPFLIGQTDKKFMVTFDWIINKTNYQKIMEGNYIERIPVPQEDKFIKLMREEDAKKNGNK